ncbi:MAG: hypothetical protein K2J88_03615 [Oscillospiraceae bacterium]|nr:hypothetical protein [Oscillospiraceae bacterium]
MAKKNKLTLDFDDVILGTLQRRLNEVGGSAKQTAESALKASHNHVTKKLETAIKPHKKTGETENSLRETPIVEWIGDMVAEAKVGFNISDGGFPSIFLMYGTNVYGQPHIKPDNTLKNAIYGMVVKNEIRKIQLDAYKKSIERAMKK